MPLGTIRRAPGSYNRAVISQQNVGGFYMSDNTIKAVDLSGDENALLVERKATCPFIGSAVAQGELLVRNEVKNPLASIEDVRRLGNTGGGDLGDLLVLFASGNHAFMLGDSGKLDKAVPSGFFSLELPGSQGSHPGHSGILQGDPQIPGSGRLSEVDFARLTSRARDGWIKRSDVGRFIAENLAGDEKSKVFGTDTAALLAGDVVEVVKTTFEVLKSRLFDSDEDESNTDRVVEEQLTKLMDSDEEASKTHRDTEVKLTKLLGENNLAGSAGEFGLLFAFLANKPGAKEVEGEPAVAVEDLQAMFVDKHLPDGWETWKKSRIDWVRNTTGLMISAAKEYLTLKPTQ
jgi:hypothetical protein